MQGGCQVAEMKIAKNLKLQKTGKIERSKKSKFHKLQKPGKFADHRAVLHIHVDLFLSESEGAFG